MNIHGEKSIRDRETQVHPGIVMKQRTLKPELGASVQMFS